MIRRSMLAALAVLATATALPTAAMADPPWARGREWEHRRDRGWERERWHDRHEYYRRGYYAPPPPPVYYAPPPRPYYPPPGVFIPFR